MTQKDIEDHYKRIGKKMPDSIASAMTSPEAQKGVVRRKYGNSPTDYKGKTYDSQKEAQRAQELDMLMAAGEIVGWVGQVEFVLPGGVRYFADFVVLGRDGRYRVEDVKSEATRKDKVYRIKRRQMRECLNIEIVEV